MRRRTARSSWLALVALAPAPAFAQTPLDVNDPTPRDVFFQVATGAQSFGPSLPASYSASGGAGTLVIPVESHEQMRDSLAPIPGTFTPIVIHIDLATLAATSEPATGTVGSDVFWVSFSPGVLATGAPAGFVGPTLPPYFCTSQQQVDSLCPFFPPFCGQTCTLVPGSPYDPATGEIELVGPETRDGCDGNFCPGPATYLGAFHLRLLETTEVPALPWPAALLLALGLAAAAPALRRRWRV